MRREHAGLEMDALVGRAVNVDGVRVVAAEVSPPDMDGFRTLGDGLRGALGTGGVGVIGREPQWQSVSPRGGDRRSDQSRRAGRRCGQSHRKDRGRGRGAGGPHLAQAGGKIPRKDRRGFGASARHHSGTGGEGSLHDGI